MNTSGRDRLETISNAMDFSGIEVITFDCYGTLIDWETGILRAVRAALPALERTDAEILEAYSEVEPTLQGGVYRKYRAILQDTLKELAQRFGQAVQNPDGLADSLGEWQPFPDTIPALTMLKERYKLAIISNVDDDLFKATAERLVVPFDFVITAEQARCYKPGARIFEMALERIGLDKARILHVAESLFHDIAHTRKLGITNVWVDRPRSRAATASQRASVEPSLVVWDLKTLAVLTSVS